ncbi:hypothetical protein MRB53_032097 [Persea americana]|uniref:Uncharacterized protein n=1 Tax=Persea americana TaxID=3435 RepID=A0ACC2KR67_PERAE|nr:hypothetical protein MRB53_032097 [Persea americana]
MASWVRTITSPLRKACIFFNHPKEKKPQQGQSRPIIDLHGEVMACGYEDVQVMWSILHKSPGQECAV